MYGHSDATFFVLTAEHIDEVVINALEASASSLGHASGCSVVTLSEAFSSDPNEPAEQALKTFVMRADPWAVVAIDDESIRALAAAFKLTYSEFGPDRPAAVLGYTLVAVPGFATCLGDNQAKRIAWHRLKAARHPGNPLSSAQ